MSKTKEGPRKGDCFYLYREIDLYRPIYFAGASGIFSPLYIDPIFGRMLGLGGNILHEACLFSFVVSAIEEWRRESFIVKSLDMNFLGTVNPGEIIKISGEVIKVEKKQKKVTIKIVVQAREKTIAKGKAIVKL